MYNRDYSYGENYGGGAYPPGKSFSERLRGLFADSRRRELMLLGTLVGAGVICYYIAGNLYSYILTNNGMLHTLYEGNRGFKLIVEMLYSFICVALPFFAVYRVIRRLKIYSGSLPFELPEGGTGLFLLILAGLGLCFIGNLVSNVLYSYATAEGVRFYSYTRAMTQPEAVPDSILSALISVLHTAVIPALAEEFVFRGIVMQPLRRYGDWFAILSSGVIFGLVHGNVMQVPFAVIAGVALGYTAVVTGSLWASMLLHFLNNLVSLIYSFAMQSIPAARGMLLSALLIYGVILIGVLAFFGYAFKNRNFMHLRPGDRGAVRHKAALYFLVPTMLMGIFLMLWMTLNDIVGFAEIFR